MIAVCGIGNPSGRLNSATTAYQSASPPMVAASANAATKPNTGCIGSNSFAITNSASVPTSTSVASALTRRSSAARAASPGASNENVRGTGMVAFGALICFKHSATCPSPSFRGVQSTNPESRDSGSPLRVVRNNGGEQLRANAQVDVFSQKEGPLEAGPGRIDCQ